MKLFLKKKKKNLHLLILIRTLKEKTNSEIANALSISENTVKFHVKNILQKTGCKNRNSLVFMYVGFFDD